MSGSTCSKKAATDNAEPKPLSNEEDGSNFAKWVAVLNRVLCVAFNSELSVNDLPLLLENRSSQENIVISHFINATLPPDFSLCIGIIPSRGTEKEFFDAIKARCCQGNCFQKLQVVRDLLNFLVENGASQNKPNTTIILALCKIFAIFKKLGVDAEKLKDLLAQATCHAPASLDWVAFDQLVMSAILAKGEDKPLSTFVGQVILNKLQRENKNPQHALPFVYCISEPQECPAPSPRPRSPYFARPIALASNVQHPPEHLVDKFGGSCFHCGHTGHWQADCPHTKGVANPNPRLALPGPSQALQIASCSLFPARNINGNMCCSLNSSITISQTTTLKIPVKHGFMIVQDVPFSAKILGTILSVGRLCRAGVIPFFNALLLLLLFCNVLVTTTFLNDCWWIDVVSGEETSSPHMFEMNPVSLPQMTNLSLREWHEQLGHACDKVVISFLKQHVPTFNIKSWQTFYCPVCAKSKSTHQLAKACTHIPKEKPLDLLGPFKEDAQGLQYLLTIRDHVFTYSIIYPHKSWLDVPTAILDAIKQLQVRTGLTSKALRTNNSREFTSAVFADSLAKLGVTFCPTRECSIHNRIPNSWCPKSSPHQELFGWAPSITMLYPHGADAIVHIPVVHQWGKLAPRAIDCKLLKPLMMGSWLLWDQKINKMLQSASVISPHFQPSRQAAMPTKGCLTHIMNTMVLGKVPTEQYFEEENHTVSSLPLVKDVKIPSHLGQALSGPHCNQWRTACMTELNRMAARDVWDVVRPGVDCAETYAPTASLMSLRLMLVASVLNGWQVASFDVSGTYLHSPVDECILVEPPTFFLPELRGKVLSLKKALYGMRQVGRFWWKFLSGILQWLGFVAMEVDQSLYIFHSERAVIAIWIHVNNGVVTLNSLVAISNFKVALISQLDIKWSNQLDQIVGLECVFGKGEVAITQWRLTDSILEAYPRNIVAHESPLPVLPVGVPMSKALPLDVTPFRSVISLLAYLVSGSRPDLAFVVNYLACHSIGPTPAHWDLLDHVGDAPILWGSKWQSIVALSTCAAEYITLSNSTQHLVQVINQLGQLVSKFDKTIFCDNQAMVQVLLDNKLYKQMRYLDQAFFFVNDMVRKHGIKIIWVKTDNMLADALTKRLSGPTLLQALPFLGDKKLSPLETFSPFRARTIPSGPGNRENLGLKKLLLAARLAFGSSRVWQLLMSWLASVGCTLWVIAQVSRNFSE
ncbi:hypothetical protein O181_022185 [Austropuccinia psidii MF-1]|uniref:CCHC-type domain-containing protein n=1 Tax=Austropuccinia psidii MF-1 TaxID=1389203 RepID=A0A9Q3GXU6_9BASI|nr:hypothetical protein [Austropuccinia psidii MF-1]